MKVFILIFSLLLCSCYFADGTVCVEPFTLSEKAGANKRNIAKEGIFQIGINEFDPIEVTNRKGGLFRKLRLAKWHTVDIQYNGRPFSYFRFYFDEYKSKHLRLLYFPEYGYWQLRPADYRHQCKLSALPDKSQ